MTEILKLTDRWNMTIYVSKADFESGKQYLPLYTARGNRVLDLSEAQAKKYGSVAILRENIENTPERAIAEKKTHILIAHIENTDKSHHSGSFQNCNTCSRLMAAAF